MKYMLVLLGLPRSGKDTVAEWIVQNYDAWMIQLTWILSKPIDWLIALGLLRGHKRDYIHKMIPIMNAIFGDYVWFIWWWLPLAVLSRKKILVINSPRRPKALPPLEAIARVTGRKLVFVGFWSPDELRWKRSNEDTSGKDRKYPTLEAFLVAEQKFEAEIEPFRLELQSAVIINDDSHAALLERAEEVMELVL